MGEVQFFAQEVGKYFKPRGLDTLILYVTSRCNAKCGFCFYGEELNQVPELSLENIVEISEKLKSLKGLLIGGGEPFLRTDLEDIVSAFVKNCKIEVVQIPTNGFFTDRTVNFVDKTLTAFPNLNLSIQVSLDAIGEKHDSVRVLKNCFKKAENTLASLKTLKNKNSRLRVLVVSVLTPETVGSCKELSLYVREKINPDYHWFEPVRDMPTMADQLKFSPETLNYLHDNLKYYLKKIQGTSSSVYASSLFNKLITEYSLGNFNMAYNNFTSKKRWPVHCCAGKKMAVLYPDGVLSACELRDESVQIKDYDFDINKAIRDEKFQIVQEDIKKHACDCTHGCFIPTSVRYSASHMAKILLKSVFNPQ